MGWVREGVALDDDPRWGFGGVTPEKIFEFAMPNLAVLIFFSGNTDVFVMISGRGCAVH